MKEELVELVLCQQASLSDSVADIPTADNLGETTIQHDLNCHITSDVPDLSTPSLISEDDSAPPESPTPPTHVTNLEPDFQERDQVNSFLKGDMGSKWDTWVVFMSKVATDVRSHNGFYVTCLRSCASIFTLWGHSTPHGAIMIDN